MLKAKRILLQVPVLLPDADEDAIRSRYGLHDVRQILDRMEEDGGTIGAAELAVMDTIDSDEAAIALASAGADVENFVADPLVPLQDFVSLSGPGLKIHAIVRPTSVPVVPDDTVVLVSRPLPDGSWTAAWGVSGGQMQDIPAPHPTEEDALADARRRHAASSDPEAEPDEFDDTVHADPFDADVHYAALLIDDENRWRGRWYRGEWTGEGAYTDLLYDTPGRARRAAKRLRGTGDES